MCLTKSHRFGLTFKHVCAHVQIYIFQLRVHCVQIILQQFVFPSTYEHKFAIMCTCSSQNLSCFKRVSSTCAHLLDYTCFELFAHTVRKLLHLLNEFQAHVHNHSHTLWTMCAHVQQTITMVNEVQADVHTISHTFWIVRASFFTEPHAL